MNTKKFMQTDSKWSELGYPKNPCYVGRDGCGMVSIANCIIEMEQYKDYTPKTIHPYCKQYAAPNCDGTYWSGIPAMMKHYGMTEVKEHATMDKLWKELEKGGRVAIYLMGSRPGGSKGVHWSSGAHFVCSVGYKYENGKHKVYVKDSYSNSKQRNEWISYEDNMRNNVKAVWSGKLNGAPAPTPTPPTPAPTPTDVEYYKGEYPNPKKYLEYGDKGTEVTKLQKYIDWMFDGAFFEECGDADGNYGRNTLKWAKKMQRKLGFSDKESNGEVGKKTIARMKAYGKPIKPTPTPPTPPTPSKDYKVIDISFNQKNVDFSKVKADGIGGVIIRCGFRGYETAKLQEDSQYQNHIKGASKAGLPVGVYFFTQAINEKEGREEADYAISLVEKMGIPLSYPIGVDTEHVEKEKESDPEPRANKISKTKRTEAIKGFCERCLERGYRPMIYASTEWFKSKLDMSKLPYDIWCAQWASKCEYKGDIVMWQYSSKGSVKGISGRVDMNHCYIQPTPNPPKPAPKPEPEKKAYPGELPTLRLTKTNAEVIADTVKCAVIIAGNNDFHYGYGKAAHANGCYFCKTEAKHKKGKGIEDYEHTYCCNPFVGAAWAHGGCVPEALKMCQKCDSYDFHKGKGYDKSKLFDNLGKLPAGKLKKGDVLCRDNHVMLYIGDGKVVHAHGGDDNVKGSKKWNNSINVEELGKKKYLRVHRFNSSVNADMYIYPGEISKRVEHMQNFLDWYFDGEFFKECGKADGIYMDNTYKWLCKFQELEIGKGEGDGIAGPKTFEAMASVRK